MIDEGVVLVKDLFPYLYSGFSSNQFSKGSCIHLGFLMLFITDTPFVMLRKYIICRSAVGHTAIGHRQRSYTTVWVDPIFQEIMGYIHCDQGVLPVRSTMGYRKGLSGNTGGRNRVNPGIGI